VSSPQGARSAGREQQQEEQEEQEQQEEVDSWTAVMVNPQGEVSVGGRQVVLKVGVHGMSVHDPFGALLKVVPIEYITGWKSKDDGAFEVVISKDLSEFFRLTATQVDGTAVGSALARVCRERAEAIANDHFGGDSRRHTARQAAPVSRQSLSLFFQRMGSSVISRGSTAEQPGVVRGVVAATCVESASVESV